MSNGAKVGIPPRRMKIDYNKLSVNYYADDAVMTIFWNTLSMLFPEGEQFFVRAVRNYQDQIDNPTLRNEISGFIGQEAFHTLGHKGFNAHLESLGYPVKTVDKVLNQCLMFLNKRSPRLALYVTCILEHYTATLATQLLDDPVHNSSVLGEARHMWLHHAIEEVEHRAVSYDVLRSTGGDFTKLTVDALFIPVSVVFAAVVAVLFGYNLFTQKVTLRELRSITKLLSLLKANTPKILDWFDSTFHPKLHNSKNIETIKKELKL